MSAASSKRGTRIKIIRMNNGMLVAWVRTWRILKQTCAHTNARTYTQTTIQIANRRYTHTVKRSSIEQLNNVKMHKHTPNRIFQTNWFWSFISVESRRRVIWRIISYIRSYNLFDIIVEIHIYIQFLFFSFRFGFDSCFVFCRKFFFFRHRLERDVRWYRWWQRQKWTWTYTFTHLIFQRENE